MSFILDALKKSEIERQRQAVPGLMDARSAPRRNRLPVWISLLAVLLGINIVLMTVLMRRETPTTATSTAPAGATSSGRSSAAATPEAADHFSPLAATPIYAPEIPVTASDAAVPSGGEQSGPKGSERTAAQPPRSTARPLHRGDPLLLEDGSGAGKGRSSGSGEIDDANDEVIPSISELSLTGAQALPELHLDVHVYATKSAERFVYINMRKYHEGSTLQEGPVVERIRRDGVVLGYQGLRFLLPRES